MSCPADVDYDDESRLALGADLLMHATPKVRLGVGAQYVPWTKTDLEDGDGSVACEGDVVKGKQM
jgi:hypothetical protein